MSSFYACTSRPVSLLRGTTFTATPDLLLLCIQKTSSEGLVVVVCPNLISGWIPLQELTVLEEVDVGVVPSVRPRVHTTGLNLTYGQAPLRLASERVWRDDPITTTAAAQMVFGRLYPARVLICGAPPPAFTTALLAGAMDANSFVDCTWVGSSYTRTHRALPDVAQVLDADQWHDNYIDAPVWQSFSQFGSQPTTLDPASFDLILISMGQVSELGAAHFTAWAARLLPGTELVFCGSPWGSTRVGADPTLRLLRSRPWGNFRAQEAWSESLQWRGSVSSMLPLGPPPRAARPVMPAHVCPPLVPPTHVVSRGQRKATWTAKAVIDVYGLTDSEIRRRADVYERDIANFPSHSQATGLASIGLGHLAVPDFVSPHVPNWHLWLAECAGVGQAWLEVGVMTGASGEWLATNFGQGLTQYSVEAAEVWDSVSGVDKLCWIQDRAIRVGELLVGSSHLCLPLLADHLMSEGQELEFAYHDGSHTADDTMVDLEAIWRMLAVGGVVIVDDFIYNGCTGDSTAATAVYAGRRGVLAFLALHAGEYRLLDPVVPSTQLGFVKLRATVRLIANPSHPFMEPDRTTLWCGTHDGTDQREPWGGTGAVDFEGDTFYDAVESQSFALAAMIAVPRATAAVVGGVLDVTSNALVNTGNGLSHLGEWVGHGHEHDAGAGLGNAIKSQGHAMEIVSKGLDSAVRWLFGRK